MNVILGIAAESFRLLGAMAPYLLFGFLFAGILKILLPEEKIVSHLGEGNISSSIKASIIGVPLPLCSCGVIPAAVSLRRQGANKGATLSFLISTPTTGVDSIFATYALLGPVFTVFRVATSFVTAVLCGILANFVLEEEKRPFNEAISCNICGEEGFHVHNILEKIRYMLHYAFVELLDDIGKWLIVGIIIGGFISYVIPNELISRYLGSDWKAMILMLLVGIPIYVCATGSIPIVAALMLKGMSPGAGLVFLLAGPATNTVTITVITKELGKRATVFYLLSISCASIIAGIVLNMLWPTHGNLIYVQGAKFMPDWVKVSSASVLLSLILFSFGKKLYLNKISKGEEDMVKENEVIINVPDMNCQHCVRSIREALEKLEDVESVDIDLNNRRVKIFSKVPPDKNSLIKSINSAGFKAYISEE